MAEEVVTITSDQPADVVFKQVEDALSPIGQASITKKGAINISPKSKYNGFAATTTMEGSIRKRRDSNQYDVTITYAVKATAACWLVAILGGLSCGVPALILLIPYSTTPSAIRKDVSRALVQAQEELE